MFLWTERVFAMAVVTVAGSLAGATIPFAPMPAVTRPAGTATTRAVTLSVNASPTTVTLNGRGLTYDAEALHSGGTGTETLYRGNGVSLSWTANGSSVDAATFRRNAADLSPAR